MRLGEEVYSPAEGVCGVHIVQKKLQFEFSLVLGLGMLGLGLGFHEKRRGDYILGFSYTCR